MVGVKKFLWSIIILLGPKERMKVEIFSFQKITTISTNFFQISCTAPDLVQLKLQWSAQCFITLGENFNS